MRTRDDSHCSVLRFGLLLGLGWWLLAVGVACADGPVLVIDDVPDHGVVVQRVDLSAALRLCEIDADEPGPITARDEQGALVPFQFVPDPDLDRQGKATGIAVARLQPGRTHRLRLSWAARSAKATHASEVVETPFFRIVHNPQAGGLPGKITFRASGKVFDEFRWQDRLHHTERGGFLLRNDQDASVECLADGPLCTVVCVRARYVNAAGNAPPSQPQATYHWVYLHDLPLIFVTAQVRQSEPFSWKELHFLELNYPGRDFTAWAGGAPFREGTFQATGQSHSASQWGALVDGPNVIAMFDCGQTLFHDGRGAYGTYLHAHGDRAWQSWSEAETEFSAWLWVGSADDALTDVQRLVDRSPSAARVVVTTAETHAAIAAAAAGDKWRGAMARQLEAAGRLETAVHVAQGHLPAEWTRVEAGDLSLLLERSADGVEVVSLLDVKASQELLAADTLPLFSLVVRDAQTKEVATLTADAGWGRVHVSDGEAENGYRLTFREPTDERWAGIRVTAELRTDTANGALQWDLQVTNENRRWGLWQVVFPQVSVRYLGAGSRVFVPQTAGVETSDFWISSKRIGGTYPGGWTPMQYTAAYNPARPTGLYVGLHDPFGSTKDISAASQAGPQAVTLAFKHPVPDMGRPGLGFELPGAARWQLLRGDWFDAAMIYRAWAAREAKWWPTLGPDGRSDTPTWMRQLPAWVMTGGPASDCVPRVKAFAQDLGVPVGFHWYNWHEIPFDNDYPHYFPPKDGFAEGVAELKRAGVYVMPYINGRLWDTHDSGSEDGEFTRVALPATTKDEQGNPYTETYGSKESDGASVTLAAMCPTTPLWQGRVREIVLRLFSKYGLNGVYIDQVAAAKPRLCFDVSHGHALGGGHWWMQGYWEMLDAIRAAQPAACMLTTECNAEPYVKWFDGYLTWHWQQQDMVPAFAAVYGGTIQMFGRAYRGGPTQDLAHRMKAGQQLVFGEQIGWFGPEIIDRPACGQFLRDCIQLRWRLREYFYAGRMARPPKLAGAIPTVTADWQWSGEWLVTTKAALTGAWRIPGKRKTVLLFANVSDQPLTAQLEFDPLDYGFTDEPLTATPRTPAGPGERFTIRATERPQMELPPQAVFAWEIAAGSTTK